LRKAQEGKVLVANKQKRIDTICGMLQHIMRDGELGEQVAVELRGKMQHAQGQTFARVAAIMMPEVRARAGGKCKGKEISVKMEEERKWAQCFLRQAAPRTLLARDPRKPVLIFTDAALEGKHDEMATYGGVFLDGERVETFNGRLRQSRLKVLQERTKKVITVLEALPVAAAVDHWKKKGLVSPKSLLVRGQ